MTKELKRRNMQMFKAHNKGVSYRKIAKIWGLDVKTVFEIIQRYKNKAVDK